MNTDFLTVTMTNDSNVTYPVTLRKSKIVAVCFNGMVVDVSMEGIQAPFRFSLDTVEAAKNLYHQIAREMDI